MKRIILSAVMTVASLSLFATGEQLLKFMPAQADGVICVDVARALDHQGLKDLRQSDKNFNDGFVRLENELKKYRLKPADLIRNAALFLKDKDNSGVVIDTGVSEKKLDEMIAGGFGKSPDFQLKFKKEQIGGRSVYSFIPGDEVKEAVGTGDGEQEGALTYLDASHVLIVQKNNLDKILKAIDTSALSANPSFQQRLSELNAKAVAWVIFNVPAELVKQPADPNQANPIAAYAANIVSGGFALDFADMKKKDVDLAGFLRCKDDKSAKMLSQQFQMSLMLYTGMAFSNDPQLSMAISNAIRINAEGKDIKLKVAFSEALQNQLKAYSAKMAAAKTADNGVTEEPAGNNGLPAAQTQVGPRTIAPTAPTTGLK